MRIISFLVTGNGDVTYNPRRNILGAIPIEGEIVYHLYQFPTSKADNNVKLIRKSRWHTQYRTEEGIYIYIFLYIFSLITDLFIYFSLNVANTISGFDFNPNGEIAGTIDKYGICLISDINTNNYRFHINFDVIHNGGKKHSLKFMIKFRFVTSFFPLNMIRYHKFLFSSYFFHFIG